MKSRITTSWKIAGTETFRLASSKVLDYYGTNLQNPTASLMRCVIPDPGYVFIQRDQSGAEALVVAHEAPVGRFLSLFNNNIKPHTYMALQIFIEKFRDTHPLTRYKAIDPTILATYPEWPLLKKRIEKDSPKEYALGKMVIHAKNYDMGPKTFQLNCLEKSNGLVNLTYKEAKNFLSIHEENFPEIIMWQAEIRTKVSLTRRLSNLFGYIREFNQPWSSELERQAYAFIPQSTVGSITNLAFMEMFYHIKKGKLSWRMLNNKHDSILIQVPEDEATVASMTLKCFIERNLTSSRGVKYQMKSSVAYGKNWAKYDERTNTEGMKEI